MESTEISLGEPFARFFEYINEKGNQVIGLTFTPDPRHTRLTPLYTSEQINNAKPSRSPVK